MNPAHELLNSVFIWTSVVLIIGVAVLFGFLAWDERSERLKKEAKRARSRPKPRRPGKPPRR